MYIIAIALIAGSSAYIKTNHTVSMAINGIEAIAVVFLILDEIKNKSFNGYSYATIAFFVFKLSIFFDQFSIVEYLK